MPVRWTVTPRQAWTPGMKRYESAVRHAVFLNLQSWAPRLESEAKDNAPWTDRTDNARQTLSGGVQEEPTKAILYLRHGMPYGIWLETSNGGKYGIVKKTLESHYDEIFTSIKDLLA